MDSPLPRSRKYAFGLGHVLNDLCASMWFTYLLLFFHKVLQFDNIYAGVVLFTGQIADGLATTFVGYFSDKGDNYWLCNKYGKRKSWHLVGTACVLLSFPFIFLPCIDCHVGDKERNPDEGAQIVYYAAFVVIFQFGWAATQISHLSMIPDLTPSTSERTELTAIRYAMTVISNIAVYLVTWIFLGMKNQDGMIGPEDASQFRNIMLVSVCVGATSSFFFHFFVNPQNNEENRLNTEYDDIDGHNDGNETEIQIRRMKIKDWLKEPQFYQVAGVYMTTRLFVNLTQAYIPLYLQITLQLHAQFVAIIPLIMFVFGFLTSIVMKSVNNRLGRKATFLVGCAIGVIGCIWIKAGCQLNNESTKYEIYGVAALIGAGGSTLLITSLSLTADLIGRNSESGAFVYGSMSLSDKISNGVAVILIQHFIPTNIDTCIECRRYFRDVLFWICGGAAVIGALFMLTLMRTTIGQRYRDRPRPVPDPYQGIENEQQDEEGPDENTPLVASS